MIKPTTFSALPLSACCALGISLSLFAVPLPIAAQEVVQALPSGEVDDLNSALQRLARNSQDVDALVDAGEASLALNDIDAAVGFFGRAEELSPQNSRVMLGLARASVRGGDPLRAIGLFNAAEQAGAAMARAALDRGLAYDLVGDSVSAQAEYRRGLEQGEDPEIRRRLALSQAISGDREGFQETLNPLVARGDSASYRTRAFGLAILGEEDEAVAIADAVMPRAMSARMEPYLRYMKRLTPAQQAAAANLGKFPRAAQIGRDTPGVAQYREQNGLVRTPDARLVPQGEPLGRDARSSSPRRRPDRAMSTASAAETADAEQLPESVRREVARVERQRRSDPLSRTRSDPVIVRRADRTPAEPAVSNTAAEVPVVAETTVSESPERSSTVAEPVMVARADSPQPPVAVAVPRSEAQQPVGVAVTELPATSAAAQPQVQPPANGQIAAPGFDLANIAGSTDRATETVQPGDSQDSASVADAFAAFAAVQAPVPAKSGGVDITKIEPPREVEKAAPEAPAHPSRYWVQVATGRDVSALGFDWRRFSRKAPDVLGGLKPHVTPWGEANRLLAGPYASREDARKAMNSLKESGVDGFTYTSPQGEEIRPLD